MLIKEIMTKKLVTVDSNDTVKNACDKYREYKVGCFVITSLTSNLDHLNISKYDSKKHKCYHT